MGLLQIFHAEACCCGSATLKTGSLIICILDVVFGVLGVLGGNFKAGKTFLVFYFIIQNFSLSI